MAGEEFLIGQNFSRDGSDYDPSAPTPAWSDIMEVIWKEQMRVFELVVLGILYPGGKPDGFSFITTYQDMIRAINPNGPPAVWSDLEFYLKIEKSLGHFNGDNTIDYLGRIYNMKRVPEHIYGFVLRKIR